MVSALALFLAQSAGSRAATCSDIYKDLALKSRIYLLEAGDEATLEGQTRAIFLGTLKDRHIFINKENGSFIVIPLKETVGLPGSTRPFNLKVMRDPIGDSCAVISTVACLRVLNEMDGIEHPVLNRMMNPSGFWDRIASFEKQLFEFISNQGVHAWIGKDASTQLQARESFLEAHGIRSQSSHSTDALEAHLSKGFPAILDGAVRFTNDGGAVIPVKEGASSHGLHSVTAFRWFKLSNGQARVLVYDSYSQRLLIWDADTLHEAANQQPPLQTFTLVWPSWAPREEH